MIDILTLLTSFLDSSKQVFSGNAHWWVYAIIALIPICIVVTVREVFCWFIKVNTFVRKLDKIDKRLAVLTSSFEELARVLKTSAQISKIRPDQDLRSNEVLPDSQRGENIINPASQIPGVEFKQKPRYKPSLDYGTNNRDEPDQQAKKSQDEVKEPDSGPFTLGLGGKNWK